MERGQWHGGVIFACWEAQKTSQEAGMEERDGGDPEVIRSGWTDSQRTPEREPTGYRVGYGACMERISDWIGLCQSAFKT